MELRNTITIGQLDLSNSLTYMVEDKACNGSRFRQDTDIESPAARLGMSCQWVNIGKIQEMKRGCDFD